MGMFDTVLVKCPNCDKEQEVQTKVGDCNLGVYYLNNVPTSLAVNLCGTKENCLDCGSVFLLLTEKVPQYTEMRAVPVEDNYEEWMNNDKS